MKYLVRNDIITSDECDIFYKTDDGFERYLNDGIQILKGDNSDNLGTVTNLQSIWDYYDNSNVFEATAENGDIIIAVEGESGINKYEDEMNFLQYLF